MRLTHRIAYAAGALLLVAAFTTAGMAIGERLDATQAVNSQSGLSVTRIVACGSVVSPQNPDTHGGWAFYGESCSTRRLARARYAAIAGGAGVVLACAAIAYRRLRPKVSRDRPADGRGL